MEANSWRWAQGDGPAMDSAGAVDWRSQLQPEARERIVNWIMEHLQRHVSISVTVGLNELQKIALRFEEGIYSVATSQQDYLRKISRKILSMETKAQHITIINPAIPNSGVLNQTSSDSANNWRSAQGDGPAMDSVGAVDWRSQLQPEARQRIVNKIMEHFQRHVSIPVPECLNELKKIVVRFEEGIYSVATSQQDYLRKISLKMLSIETKAQHTTPINPAIPNSVVVKQTSSYSEYCERFANMEIVDDASSDECSGREVMMEVSMETVGDASSDEYSGGEVMMEVCRMMMRLMEK